MVYFSNRSLNHNILKTFVYFGEHNPLKDIPIVHIPSPFFWVSCIIPRTTRNSSESSTSNYFVLLTPGSLAISYKLKLTCQLTC